MTFTHPEPLSRSRGFSVQRQPLQQHANLQLMPAKVFGPFRALNPTRAHFLPAGYDEEEEELGLDGQRRLEVKTSPHDQQAEDVEYLWSSRDNRKGRHQLGIKPAREAAAAKYLVPESTLSLREIVKNLKRMLTHYPYWDVSWLVAYIFTWGSIIWVINAFFVWMPLVRPGTEFKNEISTGGGVTAFIGATVFEIGSILLMLEAINENRSGCFGWAVQQVFDEGIGRRGLWKFTPDVDSCTHHHQNRHNLVGKSANSNDKVKDAPKSEDPSRSWIWYPSWVDLSTHYIHEIGFLASSFQLMGATIFWISGFTALPGILNHLSPRLEDGIYWTPQIIGGSGFIISGTLFMFETQKKWYIPALDTLGWHIGFWNLIGGMGFTFCPAFGYDTKSWAQYQASLSTFWGSWAFLIGSLIQLYESLQKHPVDVVTEKGHLNYNSNT